MKVKTSVSLSDSLLRDLDDRLGDAGNRSEFIESVLREKLRDLRRSERAARDVEIYNRMADDPEIQREIEETMELAIPWWELGDDVELAPEVEERLQREAAARGEG